MDLDRFCWQYLQLELEQRLDYPPPEVVRTEACQSQLYERLFAPGLPHPPPHRYKLRVLKELVGRIEASIEDWDEHGISDDLATALTVLMSQPTPSETAAAQQKSYVTYHLPLLQPQPGAGGDQRHHKHKTVTLLETRHLIAASGTTGLRTWEAALHLGQYLCAHPEAVRGRRVLELGAGTGYLSVLCAAHLGATHVIASDGSDDVVANLPESAYLNGLEGQQLQTASDGDDRGSQPQVAVLQPMDLKWGHALVGTEDARWNGGAAVDIVLGADITYDAGLVPPLLGTLGDLVDMFPDVEVLIAATERNADTYAAFLGGVARSADVELREEVDFAVDGTRGPFFSHAVPIRICRLGRKGSSQR